MRKNKKGTPRHNARTPKSNNIVSVRKADRNKKISSSDIQVLMCRVGKEPTYTIINNDLKSMQQAVGGHIEIVRLGHTPLIAVVNEEGRILGLAPNRAIRMPHKVEGIVGDFFIAKGVPDGTIASITEDDVELIHSKSLLEGYDGTSVFW